MKKKKLSFFDENQKFILPKYQIEKIKGGNSNPPTFGTVKSESGG